MKRVSKCLVLMGAVLSVVLFGLAVCVAENEIVVVGDEGVNPPVLRVLDPASGYGIVASAGTFNP